VSKIFNMKDGTLKMNWRQSAKLLGEKMKPMFTKKY
jgi:hypothetical protein